MIWFWGDTNRPRLSAGKFSCAGCYVAFCRAAGGLDPSIGVNLDYVVDDEGFAKRSCEMPGDGPTWIDGLTTVTGPTGEEELYAAYMKVAISERLRARLGPLRRLATAIRQG